MKEWSAFFTNLIDKFDFKELMICLFVVLSLMLVPRINVLSFLMPLDSAKKWIVFVFVLIAVYLVLTLIILIWKSAKKYNDHKPKQLAKMMKKYGKYLEVFYSKNLGEYSKCAFDLYTVPDAVVGKLQENKIIYIANYTHSEFALTDQARKKLTQRRKMLKLIDKIIVKKSK